MARIRHGRDLQVALWKAADRILVALDVVGEVGLVAALFLPGLAGGLMLFFHTWGAVLEPDAFHAISFGSAAGFAAFAVLLRLTLPPIREWFDRKWHVYRLIHQLP